MSSRDILVSIRITGRNAVNSDTFSCVMSIYKLTLRTLFSLLLVFIEFGLFLWILDVVRVAQTFLSVPESQAGMPVLHCYLI